MPVKHANRKRVPAFLWAEIVLGKCPYCLKVRLEPQRMTNYEFLGCVAPSVAVMVCPNCDGHIVSEHTWKTVLEPLLKRTAT